VSEAPVSALSVSASSVSEAPVSAPTVSALPVSGAPVSESPSLLLLRKNIAAALVRVARCRLQLAASCGEAIALEKAKGLKRYAQFLAPIPDSVSGELENGGAKSPNGSEGESPIFSSGNLYYKKERESKRPAEALDAERAQHITEGLRAAAAAVLLCATSGEAHTVKAWAHLAAASLGSGNGSNGSEMEDALDAERHARVAVQLLPNAPQPRLALGAYCMLAKQRQKAYLADAQQTTPSAPISAPLVSVPLAAVDASARQHQAILRILHINRTTIYYYIIIRLY